MRMKNDRGGGKRNNWLLIKHRDEFALRTATATLTGPDDRSVASGRTMAAIADGKGAGPTPFMLAAGKSQSNTPPTRSGIAEKRASLREKRAANEPAPQTGKKRAGTQKSPKTSLKLPDFVIPQLCESVERPPNGAGWVHEIKFDGYRIQLRILDGKVTLKTRKGLDWTGKFDAIAHAARGLPDGIIDGEIVALNANGAPDFSALQAALSDGNTEDSSSSRSTCCLPMARLLARCRWPAQEEAQRTAGCAERQGQAGPLRRAFRERRRCRAASHLQALSRRYRLQEARRALSLRPLRSLDQGKVPRGT